MWDPIRRPEQPGDYTFTVTATDSTRKTKQTTSAVFSVTLSA